MICPECAQRMTEICEECGTFFYTPMYELSDLSNYNIKHKRDYKKMDHFKEVLNQFQAKEDKTIPLEVIHCVKENLPPMLYTVTHLVTKPSGPSYESTSCRSTMRIRN